jgi:hypothetical protein
MKDNDSLPQGKYSSIGAGGRGEGTWGGESLEQEYWRRVTRYFRRVEAFLALVGLSAGCCAGWFIYGDLWTALSELPVLPALGAVIAVRSFR